MSSILSQRIKELRIQKGYSQQKLAEESGLSLRTIQRVENQESTPHGDSLLRLARALDVSTDEILELHQKEDRAFLSVMHLSALSFLFFPFLGIIIPLVLWISKKDKVKKADETGKQIINFQITWCLVFFGGYVLHILDLYQDIQAATDISPSLVNPGRLLIFFGIMYGFNLLITIINVVRARNDKSLFYHPKINFIRN